MYNFSNFVYLKENSKPSPQEFEQAIEQIQTLIPKLSQNEIKRMGMEESSENIIKLNQMYDQKVRNGDDETLDKLWDIAWSLVMKNSINIISAYTK